MATEEIDVLLQKKNKNGNNQILYPVTKTGNVIDNNNNSLDEFLLNLASAIIAKDGSNLTNEDELLLNSVSAIITEDGSYLTTEGGYYLIIGF